MKEQKELPKRRPTHMPCFDYSENHRYFITICADNRKQLFGRITVGEGLAPPEINLSLIGKVIQKQLLLISERFHEATVEKYVIMPNHLHILLIMQQDGKVSGGASPSPTTHNVICALKSLVTRECRRCGYSGKIWQRSYYEHIIRNEDDYKNTWIYIENNPAHWAEDKYFQ